MWDRPLSAAEIAAQAREKRFPRQQKRIALELAAGPFLRFTGDGGAIVTWETKEPSPTVLEWGLDSTSRQRVETSGLRTQHEATLAGLRADRRYTYLVHARSGDGDKTGVTAEYECDTFFDFHFPTLPERPDPWPQNDATRKLCSTAAERILGNCGVDRGVCLVVDSGDGRLAYEIARRSGFTVIAVDTDAAAVERSRRRLLAAGLYGRKVTVLHVESLAELPFTGQFANLVVVAGMVTSERTDADAREIARVLRPFGGVAYVGRPDAAPGVDRWSQQAITAWLRGTGLEVEDASDAAGVWAKVTRGALPNAGVWTHQYGRPDNSAFGGEALGGAAVASDLEVQWIGRPGPRAQPDRNGRKPSPLAAGGRLFVQGLQRIVALDAFNGTVLWSWEIPPLGRFNMPRDCGNWCADDDSIYAAVGNRCWRFDAATGAMSKVFDVRAPTGDGEHADEEHDWSYLARYDDHLIGSAVRKGTAFTNFWGGGSAGWYDAKSGAVTHKVVSENLFSLYLRSGAERWSYADGLIINSTICVADGRAYFVESRNQEVKAADSRRVGLPALWKDQRLVALDIETGNKVLDAPIDTADGTTVFYMAHGEGHVVVVASGGGRFNVDAFRTRDGSLAWQREFGWEKDNHGAHMSRPAIVGNRVFVRPRVFDLRTGEPIGRPVPGGGCGTYAATTGALFFRAGNVTMWDAEKGRTTSWHRLRPDCWLSTIPANGMLLSPEGGGGCSCGSWLETSVGFVPVKGASK